MHPAHPISVRFILILSYRVRPSRKCGLFSLRYRTKILRIAPMTATSRLTLKLLSMQFSRVSLISSNQNIASVFMSILYSPCLSHFQPNSFNNSGNTSKLPVKK